MTDKNCPTCEGKGVIDKPLKDGSLIYISRIKAYIPPVELCPSCNKDMIKCGKEYWKKGGTDE